MLTENRRCGISHNVGENNQIYCEQGQQYPFEDWMNVHCTKVNLCNDVSYSLDLRFHS